MSDKPATLASSLDRYGEAVKWVVSLAVAISAVGIGFFKDAAMSRPEQIILSASLLLLFGSILAGVMCGLHVIAYASHSESVERNAAASSGSERSGSGVQQATNDPKNSTAARDKAGASARFWWRPTLWVFMLGMFCFVSFGGVKIWTPSTPLKSSALVPFALPRDTSAVVLLRDEISGALFRPVWDGTAGLSLTPVVVDTVPK